LRHLQETRQPALRLAERLHDVAAPDASTDDKESVMMSKRWALLLSASIAVSIAACDRDDKPADESADLDTETREPAVREPAVKAEAREERAEAEVDQVRAAPQPERRAESETETAPRAVPTDQLLTARRAEAELDTVGNAELEAEATLHETKDGVEVVVRVEDAKPGTRSVRIYDRADCDDLSQKTLGQPLTGSNKHGDLGSVTIGPSGKGTLESKAFNASLKPDDRASLLGKTIVVQERDGISPKSDGDPIACGVIKEEAKLADKAGRMAEPL
jgi:Cu/Zn superoxide dismutase